MERFCKCPLYLNSSLIFALETQMNSSPEKIASLTRNCPTQVRDDRGDAADVREAGAVVRQDVHGAAPHLPPRLLRLPRGQEVVLSNFDNIRRSATTWAFTLLKA